MTTSGSTGPRLRDRSVRTRPCGIVRSSTARGSGISAPAVRDAVRRRGAAALGRARRVREYEPSSPRRSAAGCGRGRRRAGRPKPGRAPPRRRASVRAPSFTASQERQPSWASRLPAPPESKRHVPARAPRRCGPRPPPSAARAQRQVPTKADQKQRQRTVNEPGRPGLQKIQLPHGSTFRVNGSRYSVVFA